MAFLSVCGASTSGSPQTFFAFRASGFSRSATLTLATHLTPCSIRKRRAFGHFTRAGSQAPNPEPDRREDKATLAPLDPAQTVVWGGNLPSRRRIIVGGLTALGIAIGGNLGGVTSFLLSLDGGRTAGLLKADVLIPVTGYKRAFDLENGYEFLYPANWLADQTLYYRYAKKIEQRNSLDLPSTRAADRKEVAEPSAAYGPPGSTGEENISVIVAPIRPGFRLQELGAPVDAAERFINTIAAPPGSGYQAVLIQAVEKRQDGELYYLLEYVVQGPKFVRHNLSVCAARNGLLYTFNSQCPEAIWKRDEEKLTRSAASFRLINSGAARLSFPQQL